MSTPTYTFHRGEPLAFGDRVESGTVLAGHTMRARMKWVPLGDRMPGDEVPLVSPALVTTFVPAAGAEPAYWLHSLSEAQTWALAAGGYLADTALLLGGVVIMITDPVRIMLLNSATGSAP